MRALPLLPMLCVLLACEEGPPPVAGTVALEPAEPRLSRLTVRQYRNTVRDLLGDGLALPPTLEPDVRVEGFAAIGASVATVSGRGVELYEEAAQSLAEQVMDDPALRDAVVTCTPEGPVDADCAEAFVVGFGRRAWRRPLEPVEVEALVSIAGQGADALGDFHAGLAYALSALLQSPNFLFRSELGQGGTYTGHEMASRLSYFLWNSTPDDALLDAAASGRLDTPAGIAAQVRRLIESDRARAGFRNFVSEWLDLYTLDELRKDPNVYKHFSTQLGGMAREETLRVAEHLVFDEGADFRDLLTTRTTFVNRRLAAIYNVPSPVVEGYGRVELPRGGPRAGLLGQVSILARYAHPVATSSTLRGKFVREVLLCQQMPLPPADLNVAIPEATERAPTLRDRLAVHREVEVCATCHDLMDPIGLSLERFDGIGRFRVEENDATIDPSGELDGRTYDDALGLSGAVAASPLFAPCVVRRLYSYASGHAPERGEAETLAFLEARFEESGYQIEALLFDIATSDAFRAAGAVQ